MVFHTDYYFNAVYQFRLISNAIIPGLELCFKSCQSDLRIMIGQMPDWLEDKVSSATVWNSSPFLDDDDEPGLNTWKLSGGKYFKLLYRDGTTFIIDREGTEVWTTWPEPFTLEDTTTYLLGPVFGFILRLRGITCLHASVVAINDQAIAIIGVAGAGKSTTAASFAKMGYPVLTEDVAALDDEGDRFYVRPGYPVIRLWPSSVEMLFGAPDALPLMTPNWDKRYLDLTREGFRFQNEPLPLGAIYFLQERSDDPDAPIIEPVSPQTGLIDLVANAYTNYLLDKDMRAREFDLLGRIVQRIPLRKVTPHSDPARLPDLCRAIIADFENIA